MDAQKPKPQPKDALKIKFKLVVVPFLVLSAATLLLYSGLRWLLDIQFGLLPIDQSLLQIWIPLGLSLLIAIVFIRRRFAILNLLGDRVDGYFYYPILAGILMAIPIMVTQSYLEMASYDLIQVQSPSSLNPENASKYYQFEHFDIDFAIAGSVASEMVMSSGSDDRTLHFYLALPLVDSAGNSLGHPLNAWYCQQFDLRINDNLDDVEADTLANRFISESLKSFIYQDFQSVTFFENLPKGEARLAFESAVAEKGVVDDPKRIFALIPHQEAFSERTGNRLFWCFGSYFLCLLGFVAMALLPNLDLEAFHRLKEGKPMADNEMHEFFGFFIPRDGQFVTAILVDLNILTFLVMVFSGVDFFSPNVAQLLAWGACEREAVLNGGYWRLLVSTFEHAGVFHLAMNMVGLFITGMLVEPILGRWRMALAYLFAGICGSVASLAWHENVVSVGASGAIFGLFGVMLSLLLTGTVPKAEKGAYWYILVVYGVVGLLFGFFKSGTDNAAHVGGLLGGFLIGMLFSILFRKKPIDPNSQ